MNNKFFYNLYTKFFHNRIEKLLAEIVKKIIYKKNYKIIVIDIGAFRGEFSKKLFFFYQKNYS